MSYVNTTSRFLAAFILLQLFFFDFGGAAERVAFFEALGVEPIGRYVVSLLEVVAGMLLLLRKLSNYGAGIGFGLHLALILAQVFVIGTAFNGDGGYLFGLTIVVFIACGLVLYSEFRPKKF
jgi:putative oxidoreductase